MRFPKQNHRRTPQIDAWMTIAAFLLALLMIAPATELHAQTYTVLHSFTGQADGAYPYAGLTIDRAGNLYGTTAGGLNTGECFDLYCGTVFRMVHKGSGWVLSLLYGFTGGADGRQPSAKVIVGPDGSLYGTTVLGGQGTCILEIGCGVVFNLRPPASACKSALCPWTETVLYRFSGGTDGGLPSGDLVFDPAGNLYGAASEGGKIGGPCQSFGCGVIYKLTPSNGSWTESVVYTFLDGADGAVPQGVVMDASGDIYGTTAVGGDYYCSIGSATCGTVFQLSPSQSGWTKTTLYSFQGANDGYFPGAGLTIDGSGNLYGTTSGGGAGGGGTIFELTSSGGSWVFSLLYGLTGGYQWGPYATLALDPAGNLYGTAVYDGAYKEGSVFKLTPHVGFWLYTDLYDFTGARDGARPYDGLVFDQEGNIFGTASGDGYAPGTVWEITP